MDGSVQKCSNSIALAMGLLQSCTEPMIYEWLDVLPSDGLTSEP